MRRQTSSDSFFVLIGRFASRRHLKPTDIYIFYSIFFATISIADFCDLSSVNSVKSYISNVVLPLKHMANNIVEIPKLISEYVDIKKENKRLQMELDTLKIKTITAKGTEYELNELKKSINMKYSLSSFRSVEKVLGFDKAIYNSFLIISATQKETKPGSIVISSDGLIGIIFDITDKIARVMTIHDHKINIPVKSDSGEHLILSGSGRSGLFSKEIKTSSKSVNINLQLNDFLYTSGEGGVFHANIPVAKVSKIDNEKNEIFAEPVANLQSLSFVWIINPIL